MIVRNISKSSLLKTAFQPITEERTVVYIQLIVGFVLAVMIVVALNNSEI